MGHELRKAGTRRWIAISIAALLLGAFGIKSCAPDHGGAERVDTEPLPPLPPAPQVNADSLFAYVKDQVDFGPRVPGTSEHRACADWMVATLKRLGADTVIEQNSTAKAFNSKELPLRNIIAQLWPERKKRVLIMTHYDSRPFADHDKDPAKRGEPVLAANDGGSGVAVMLELVRVLAAQPPGVVGVDFFFTDAEDYGQPSNGMDQAGTSETWCLGSQYWAKNPAPKGYTAEYGILLDMVGGRDARFHKEAFSVKTAGHVVNKVWKTAAAIGEGSRFVDQVQYFVGVDDHVYVNQGLGITVIDIIEFNESTRAFNPTWHTTEDNLENIDQATLHAVARTVVEVLWRER